MIASWLTEVSKEKSIMGRAEGNDNIMKMMSYQAAIAIAVSTIIGMMFSSGMSFGSDKKTLVETEERSKKNENNINIILLQNERTNVILENLTKKLDEIAKKKEKDENKK